MAFGINAVELLKAGNRQVEGWFELLQDTDDDGDRRTLVASLCRALTVSAELEEEIFHPAFLQAVERDDLQHDAAVRLDILRKLVADIEEANSGDELFAARVRVLAQVFQLHVGELERDDGMFDAAEVSDLDLDRLGEDMESRRSELVAESTP